VVEAPPPFRPSDPTLCGSRPLLTPCFCRLGDLLCYFVYIVLCALLSVYMCIELFLLFSLSFVDLPSVLWYCWLGLLTCKNRLPYNLYCVGGAVKHCSLTHSLTPSFTCDFLSQGAPTTPYQSFDSFFMLEIGLTQTKPCPKRNTQCIFTRLVKKNGCAYYIPGLNWL